MQYLRRTVGGHLVALDAVAAGQTGDAGLLVDLGGDGILGVTEDAFELDGKTFALLLCECGGSLFSMCEIVAYLLGALRLGGTLAFTLESVRWVET